MIQPASLLFLFLFLFIRDPYRFFGTNKTSESSLPPTSDLSNAPSLDSIDFDPSDLDEPSQPQSTKNLPVESEFLSKPIKYHLRVSGLVLKVFFPFSCSLSLF